jgi:hypothetical protein
MQTIAEALDEAIDASEQFSKTLWGLLQNGTETDHQQKLKDRED